MRILITGSQGLIGSALKTALCKLNISVQEFDLKFSPAHSSYGTILNQTALVKAARDCDGIVHLAAVSRVIWGEKDPDLCWQTNVDGTDNILETAFKSPKQPWVLYASSREVYGEQKTLPVTEDCPLKPINIYGRSKATAEEKVLSARLKGLNTAIIRFSNVYGSLNDHWDRVIPAFCSAAAKGTPLRVDGPSNTFDFSHITDVVSGILKIIDKLNTGEKDMPPLHFTTGRATSLIEAATIANTVGGNLSDILERPSRTFDVSQFYGDASQTMHFLDWQPLVLLEEGMSQLVMLFKREIMAERNSVQKSMERRYENTEGDPRLSYAV